MKLFIKAIDIKMVDVKTLHRALDVDHCHDSKKIRGLLCNRCNLTIGLFKHDSNLFANAIKYLKDKK